MWGTNLKVLAVVLVTLGVFTFLANVIPQMQSDVPQELSLSGNVTPEQLVAAGEQLFNGAGGCTACHGLGTRAPNLLTDEAGAGPIGARCAKRKPGMSCNEYLHESMVKPGAYVVAGYQPIMPDMSKSLSPAQIWSLVAFLESAGGEVTVNPEDVKAAAQSGAPATGSAATAAATAGTPAGSATKDPKELVKLNNCLNCHKLDGEGQVMAPDLTKVGSRLSPDKIRQSILDPNADTAKGYKQLAGIMPTNFGEQLTAAQLEALVKYLAAHK
jgi:mono/diheme cytochrome c family protein